MVVPQRTRLRKGIVIVRFVHTRRRTSQKTLRPTAMTHEKPDPLAIRTQVGLEVRSSRTREVQYVVEIFRQGREVAASQVALHTGDAFRLESGLLALICESRRCPDIIVLRQMACDWAST